MKSRWIEHKGKRVFYCDWTDLGYDVSALEAEVNECNRLTVAQPPNSMLSIIDVRGTVASKEAMEVFKSSSAKGKPFVRKSAVIGITGFKKVLLEAVSAFSGQSFGTFNDLEEAKDWVVKAD